MLTPDFLFSLANPAALLGHAGAGPALARHPRRGAEQRAAPAAGATYAVLIATHYLGPHGGEGSFGSLADMAALFRCRWALLAGWVHYLCFDMWTGTWEVRDAQRRGVPHGPLGLLLYFGARQRCPLLPSAA